LTAAAAIRDRTSSNFSANGVRLATAARLLPV
jgi:hypothetical protein